MTKTYDDLELEKLRKAAKLMKQLMLYAEPWIEDYSANERPRKVWDQLQKLLAE